MKAPLLVCFLAVAACVPQGTGPETVVPAAESWRGIATESDRARVRDWRKAWVRGLEQAQAAGHTAEIAAEGVLLAPDAALDGAAAPAGDYRCRVIKVGGKSEAMLDYVAYPPFRCRMGAGEGTPSFVKLTGSQRPVGRLFPENDRRMIFLGTLQLGDEQGVLRYGHDTTRDLAGILERFGDRRWRLVFPYPHFESTIDIIEVVPEGAP